MNWKESGGKQPLPYQRTNQVFARSGRVKQFNSSDKRPVTWLRCEPGTLRKQIFTALPLYHHTPDRKLLNMFVCVCLHVCVRVSLLNDTLLVQHLHSVACKVIKH
jgi:hypothetical protein